MSDQTHSEDIPVTAKMLSATKGELKHEITSVSLKVDSAEARLGAKIESEISGVKSEISGVKSEISGVKSEVSGLKSEISEVKSSIEKLTAAMHKMNASNEEQNARNRAVLDKCTEVTTRQERFDVIESAISTARNNN